MIKLSINLSKLPQDRIKQSQSGDLYITLLLNERREPDDYGNTHTLCLTQSREERQSGEAKTFVGRGRLLLPTPPITENPLPTPNPTHHDTHQEED